MFSEAILKTESVVNLKLGAQIGVTTWNTDWIGILYSRVRSGPWENYHENIGAELNHKILKFNTLN